MATPGAWAAAPGKVILFGEHAVVYGEPSLSLALDKRIRVSAEAGAPNTTVNGEALDEHRHSYILQALRHTWTGAPLRIRTESELPPGGHVGSSAALSVATCATLLRLSLGRVPTPEEAARAAFETEFATQGAASPNDTTISAAGGAVFLAPARRMDEAFLWRIEKGERAWNAHRIRLPALPLVVANSGAKARTADQVAKVRRFVERNAFAKDVIRDIGRITLEGLDALKEGDLVRIGDLMDRNQSCLHTLGVSAPAVARLVKAAHRVPGTHGAKLTGAGGGGSVIVLTSDPPAVKAAFEALGAHAWIASASPRGLEVGP